MRISEFLSPSRMIGNVIGDGLPPGPGGFPYAGVVQSLRAMEDPLREMMGWIDRHGLVFTTRFLGMKQVWFIGPAANQYILVDNAKNFSWRGGHFGDLIPLLGDGLLTTDDEQHDKARKLMLPVFNPKRIRMYSDDIVARAVRKADAIMVGQQVEFGDWTRELALNIATSLLFGMEPTGDMCKTLAHEFEKGLAYYGAFFHLQFLRGPRTPYQRMLDARQTIEKLLMEEIKRRRASGSNGENIIDMLLNAKEDGDTFSDMEVLDQAMTLLFAGHDTTTATVSWMLSLLGRNRQVYERLQAEIDATLGDRDPSTDDLIGGLTYLDQVIAETLRMYPPAWIGPRRAREAFQFAGVSIPAGTQIAYSSWLSHRLPQVFDDPEAFDPDRFTPEKRKNLQPGAYVPFGRGARLCIGMRFGELEVKAIAAVLMRRFHFELLPGQIWKARTVPTISPLYGVRMMVREKKPARMATHPSTPVLPPSAADWEARMKQAHG